MRLEVWVHIGLHLQNEVHCYQWNKSIKTNHMGVSVLWYLEIINIAELVT